MTETGSTTIKIEVEHAEPFGAHAGGDVSTRIAAERAADTTRELTLWALGLVGDDGEPDERGKALLDVLRHKGVVMRGDQNKDYEDILQLNGFLSDLFGIEDPPFTLVRAGKRWKAKFGAASVVA